MNILITGGAGYIGSHTATQALAAGYNVTVLDNLSTGFREAVPVGADFVQGEIRDTDSVIDTIKGKKIQAIIHFAAKLVVSESVANPLDYYHNNVGGTVSLAQACRATGVDKLIFSSTAAVYGEGLGSAPLTETVATKPINPYGHSKLMSEGVLRDCGTAFGLRSVCLRYFNVAGAAEDGLNGQRTRGSTHLIKIASEVACGKRSSLSIFGADYPTPDGTCIRDYIHVEDLADLHLRSLRYLEKDGESQVFNCGYGHGYSVRQVIDVMKAQSGVNFSVKEEGRRAGDPAQLIADSTKAQKTFGWEPKFDHLDLICKSAFEWERKSSSRSQ